MCHASFLKNLDKLFNLLKVLKTELLILSVILTFLLPYEESLNIADCYGLNDDDLSSDLFPLTYSLIDHEQQKDEIILAWAQKAQHYSVKKFDGGGNAIDELICFKDKIVVVLTSLQKDIIQWLSIVPSRH